MIIVFMTADDVRKKISKYHKDSSVYADLRMKKVIHLVIHITKN